MSTVNSTVVCIDSNNTSDDKTELQLPCSFTLGSSLSSRTILPQLSTRCWSVVYGGPAQKHSRHNYGCTGFRTWLRQVQHLAIFGKSGSGQIFGQIWKIHQNSSACRLFRGYHMAVFISARISSPSVDNCPRRSRRLIWKQPCDNLCIIRLHYSPTNQLFHLS